MFINQPILRDAAEAFDMADGVVIEDSGKTKSRRQEDAVQERIHSKLDNLGSKYEDLLKTILSDGKAGKPEQLNSIRKHIVEVSKQLFGANGNQYTNQFFKWDERNGKPYDEPTTGHSILEDIIVNPEVRIDPTKPMSMDNISDVPYYAITIDGEYVEFSPKEVQLYVVGAMYMLKPYVSALEDTVKYTKIDTKKHGSSWIEQ